MYGIPGMMMETVFRTQPGQCRTSICKKKIYIYINNIIICMDNNVILLNYICMYITLCTFRYMSTFIMIGKSFFFTCDVDPTVLLVCALGWGSCLVFSLSHLRFLAMSGGTQNPPTQYKERETCMRKR